jgi:hypothetical protein
MASDDYGDSEPLIRELMSNIGIREIQGPDGLLLYEIQPGTNLYRGDTGKYVSLASGKINLSLEDYLPHDKAVFFGFSELAVEKYGVVAGYQTQKPIYSVALDNPHNLNLLLKKCEDEGNERMAFILRDNYGAGKFDTYGKAVRKSVFNNDMALINYLTEKYEIGGTIFLASVAIEGGRFHPEIALPQSEINPDYIQITGIVTKQDNIQEKIDERTNRHLSKELNKNKEKSKKTANPIGKHIRESRESSSRRRLFADDDDDDDEDENVAENAPKQSSVSKALNFDDIGGSSLIKRKNKKSNKNKKSKKTTNKSNKNKKSKKTTNKSKRK